jgi:hypothetical protein
VAGGVAAEGVAELSDAGGVAAKAAPAVASAMAAARQGKAERMKLSWFFPPPESFKPLAAKIVPKKASTYFSHETSKSCHYQMCSRSVGARSPRLAGPNRRATCSGRRSSLEAHDFATQQLLRSTALSGVKPQPRERTANTKRTKIRQEHQGRAARAG